MPYKLDLHMHSHYSFDGIMAPKQIIALAKRRGLDGIAVADHNTISGGVDAFNHNQDPNFLIIVGAEIQTEVGDILGLFLHDEISSRKSEDVVHEIHAQGGMAILPHPYSHHRGLNEDFLSRLDGVEIYNGRDKQDYSVDIQREFVNPYALCPMGNSDAHIYWEIGGVYNQVDADELNVEAVRAALLSGRNYPVRQRLHRSTAAVYFSKVLKRIKRIL